MAETNIPAAPAAAQGQPSTTVETAQPATTQADTDVSSKFAHLARKEKAFRDQQRKFQLERQSWETQRQAERTKIESEIFSRYQQDPVGFSNERGVTQDQLASLLLNQQNPQEATKLFQLEQQNKQLLDQIEKINKRFEDNETNSYNQALNQIGNEAKILVKSNAESFEMIERAGEDGIEAIKQLCKVMWDEEQVLMSVQEAAEQVEQELLERSLNLASAKKVAAKLLPTAPAIPEPTKTTQALKTQQTTSLNSQTLQPGTKPPRMTDAERKRRAIAVAEGRDPNQT